KRLEEETRIKAENEARAKLQKEKEEEAAAAAAAAAAAEAKKAEQEALKRKIQEETKQQLAAEEKKKAEKAPIRFKDAVGRKFSFPFHLCQTWNVRGATLPFCLSLPQTPLNPILPLFLFSGRTPRRPS